MALSGCQSAYYSAMESVGVHKRDILVDRVEETKEAQQESQEEFQSALDRLTTLINFDGGELQDAYNQLNDDYESSLAAANDVTSNINKVEDVAEALFDEWADELEQYKAPLLNVKAAKSSMQLSANLINYFAQCAAQKAKWSQYYHHFMIMFCT